MNFASWLSGQYLGDPEREMPYAVLYDIGPLIEKTLEFGEFDMAVLERAIRENVEESWKQVEYLEALVEAESTWRVDVLLFDEADNEAPPSARYRCGFRDLTGIRCSHKAVLGGARCYKHGGAINDPEVRKSLLLVSYSKIMAGSEKAVDALLDVAQYSRTDMARVQAAKEILDRAGMVQDQHVHIHASDQGELNPGGPLEDLKNQLADVRERLLELPYTPPSDDDVVDAEIIETADLDADRS